MEQGYRKIFWGYVISIFDFNLWNINILPDFIGYFIIGSGVYKLYEEFNDKNFKTANSLANFLMCYSLIMSIVNYGISSNSLGVGLYDHPYKKFIDLFLLIFASSVTLIMSFNILSGTTALYLKKEQINEALSLEKTQKNYTILNITGMILFSVSINISHGYFAALVAVYMIIAALYFVKTISKISKTIISTN
nr:hypothetical protein [Sedimentibacter sp.]